MVRSGTLQYDLIDVLMPLTDSEIQGFEPREQSYKRSDGHALYIFIRPNGSKLWRMSYRFEGKQKTLSFGSYPIVTIEEARDLRTKAKRLLRQGNHPIFKRPFSWPSCGKFQFHSGGNSADAHIWAFIVVSP